MRPSILHAYTQKVLGIVDKGAIATCAAMAGSLKADPAAVWEPMKAALAFTQANAWWLVISASAIGASARGVKAINGDTWAWKTIQKLLDDVQKDAFKVSDPPHEHRVTLFKRSTFAPWHWGCNCMNLLPRLPWSGWIYPICRSGHTNKKSQTCFLAPDDAQHAEGVAGTAWARNEIVLLSALPDVTNSSPNDDVKTYAEATFVKPEVIKNRLQRGKATARSYVAIPIELLGCRWGVLLLDSTHPEGIKNPERLRIAKIAFMIGVVLERK